MRVNFLLTEESLEPLTYDSKPDYYISDDSFRLLVDKENRLKLLNDLGESSVIISRLGNEENLGNGDKVYVDVEQDPFSIEEMI